MQRDVLERLVCERTPAPLDETEHGGRVSVRPGRLRLRLAQR